MAGAIPGFMRVGFVVRVFADVIAGSAAGRAMVVMAGVIPGFVRVGFVVRVFTDVIAGVAGRAMAVMAGVIREFLHVAVMCQGRRTVAQQAMGVTARAIR
jgi:hypothetical protein